MIRQTSEERRAMIAKWDEEEELLAKKKDE